MKPSISDKPALIIIFSLILFFSSTSVCYLLPILLTVILIALKLSAIHQEIQQIPKLHYTTTTCMWSGAMTTGNGDIYFKRSVDNGTTFQSVENLSNSPGNSTDPQIALYNNNLYVVWSDEYRKWRYILQKKRR